MATYRQLVEALPELRVAYPLNPDDGMSGAEDIGPNGLHLTLTGSPTTVSGPIIGLDALDFDGTTQYGTRAHDAAMALGTSDFTLTGWVNPDAASGTQFVFTHDGGNTNGEWEWYHSNDDYRSRVQSISTGTTTGVVAGVWQFAALVCDRDGVGRWWKNTDWIDEGDSIAAESAASLSASVPLWIARRTAGGSQFAGGLAWMTMNATALTGTQLLEMYNARNTEESVETSTDPFGQMGFYHT